MGGVDGGGLCWSLVMRFMVFFLSREFEVFGVEGLEGDGRWATL